MGTSNSTLYYYFADATSFDFSFSPLRSDYFENMTSMENLVGTLIKYGNNGRYENYLATKWTSSANELTWDFQLKEGLVAEDGELINAANFIKSFETVFKIYNRDMGSNLAFDDLVGMKDFLAGRSSTVAGITSNGPFHLRFEFTKKPVGLLEFLSMPYFGFYSPKNFENGRWRDEGSIISSGPYRLESFDKKENAIVLAIRNDWFAHVQNAPKKVMINFLRGKPLPDHTTGHYIVHKKIASDADVPSGYTKLLGTPTLLMTFILSPHVGPFKDISNRVAFKKQVFDLKHSNPIKNMTARSVYSFYPTDKILGDTDQSAVAEFKPNIGPIKVALLRKYDSVEQSYVEEILAKVFAPSGIKHQLIAVDKSDPQWQSKLNGNSFYDIRVARVDTGGSHRSDIIKMMFCSKMGVSFEDLGGEICNLSNQYESPNSTMSLKQYADEFEMIVDKQSVVIPLYRTGLSWFFSNNINMDDVTPTMVIPRFDLLSLK